MLLDGTLKHESEVTPVKVATSWPSFGSETASLSSNSLTQTSEAVSPALFEKPVQAVTIELEATIAQASEVAAVEAPTIATSEAIKITDWDGRNTFSDLIHEGLVDLLGKESADAQKVHMVYECPSTASSETSFRNSSKWKIHDYPPTARQYWSVMRPLRYTCFNGQTFPAFLQELPPNSIVNHWNKSIPGFVSPAIVHEIPIDAITNAYMPMEQHSNYVCDPDVHYRIAGKDAIPDMTLRTTRILKNTRDERPCVAKVTHAMGSLGIFIIRNDEDEAELHTFLRETGNPDYVVTECVDIDRNMACHFFIHPKTGNITWFGSSENLKLGNGGWSSDATFFLGEAESTKEMMRPYSQDVAEYLSRYGYWGFCGIDVLFDPNGIGYTVDVNPRVTGSMPALMVGRLLNDQDPERFVVGKFRKSTKWIFPGGMDELIAMADNYNETGEGKIVVFSAFAKQEDQTQLNVAVYGSSSEHCDEIFKLVCVAMADGRD
jgi:hypothetical protein